MKLDNDTLNELRRTKSCFHCKEPWDLSRKCPLKAKANQMEYFLVKSQSKGEDQHSDSDESSTPKKNIIPKDDRSLAQLTGAQKAVTYRVRGTIQGRKVISLINTGATHNFIDARLVATRGLQTKEYVGFRVMVANGDKLLCTQKISNLHIKFRDGYELEDGFYVVDMGDYDVNLGMTWMASLVEFTLNLEKLDMRFLHEGSIVVLRGL